MSASTTALSRLNLLRATAAFLAVCLFAPFAINLLTTDSEFQSSSVFASTGDMIVLSEPVEVFHNPHIVVQSGTLSLTRDDGKKTTAGTALLDLLAGNKAGLAIDGATILIKNTASSTNIANQSQVAPLMMALAKHAYPKLKITRTHVVISSDDNTKVHLNNLTADLRHDRNEQISAKGKFDLEGETISFDSTLSLTQQASEDREKTNYPIVLSVKTPSLNAEVDGLLTTSDQLNISSEDASITISDFSRFAKWIGIRLPADQTPKKFSANGHFTWTGKTVGFFNSALALDENTANGGLTLKLGRERPMLDGTIAANSLDITPYLKKSTPEESGDLFKQVTAPIDVDKIYQTFERIAGWENSLLRNIDVDIRLSAANITAGQTEFGTTAASIALAGGKMSANITEIALSETTRGAGEVTIDATTTPMKYAVRGKLSDFAFGPVITAIVGTKFLHGTGDVYMNLTGSGETANDLIATLAGRLQVKKTSDVVLGVTLPTFDVISKSMAKPSKPDQELAAIDQKKWHKALNASSTQLENFNAEFRVFNGVFSVLQARAKSADNTFFAEGTVTPSMKRLDMRVTTQSAISSDQDGVNSDTKKTRSPPRAVVRFFGPWANADISTVQYSQKSASTAADDPGQTTAQ